MEIVDYNLKYLDNMIEVFIDSFNNSSWHDNWTSDIVYKHLNQLTTTDGFQGLVALDNNTVVGMILGIEHYSFSNRTFCIKEFCISNKSKGKGVGSILLNEMESLLKEQGFSNIELQTLNSQDVLNFYEKNGYNTDSLAVFMNKAI